MNAQLEIPPNLTVTNAYDYNFYPPIYSMVGLQTVGNQIRQSATRYSIEIESKYLKIHTTVLSQKLLYQLRSLGDDRPFQKISNITIPLSNESIRKPSLAHSSNEIQIVYSRLIALFQQEEDEDEDEIWKPTSYAFITAWDLVTEAFKRLGHKFRRASISADDRGGIRLRWLNLELEKEVSLYCPSEPNKKMYIYYELRDKYDAVYNISGKALAYWLNWLTK